MSDPEKDGAGKDDMTSFAAEIKGMADDAEKAGDAETKDKAPVDDSPGAEDKVPAEGADEKAGGEEKPAEGESKDDAPPPEEDGDAELLSRAEKVGVSKEMLDEFGDKAASMLTSSKAIRSRSRTRRPQLAARRTTWSRPPLMIRRAKKRSPRLTRPRTR